MTKIPEGVEVSYGGQTYTGTLVASASTSPFITLVYEKTILGTNRKIYGEYVTVTEGTGESGDPFTYFWEKLGTTDISIDNLGDMAFADTASGSVTVTGSTGAMSSTGTFTPEGSVSAPAITITPTTASISGMTDVGTLPSKAADTWSAGSLPSFAEGAFSAGTTPVTVSVVSETLTFTNGTAPSKAADTFSAGSLPSFTEGAFDAGTLPTQATAVNVMTGASAALNSAPVFTGTAGSVTVSTSGATITSTGTVQVTPDSN